MTKLAEIREGLIELCRERTSGAGKVLASEILDYLHSQGVYIYTGDNWRYDSDVLEPLINEVPNAKA